VEYTRELLEGIGLEPQRLQMINISSAMAGEFTFSAAEITAAIQQLGPNPLRSNGAESEAEMKKVEAEKEGVTDAGDVNDS
jgi:hypothetical protein